MNRTPPWITQSSSPADSKTRWLMWGALVAVALLHASGFGGYWISDDFGNIHQLHAWAQQGELWSGLVGKMTDGSTPAGAFYRPALQLTRGATWLVAGSSFEGWFALSWFLHLVNTGLVMTLVVRLAGHSKEIYVAAALAGVFFGASPLSSEGVYWIAAGGDAWVTLLTLVALHCWFGRAPLLVPVLFVAALGFKESAAVLPIQLLVLLIAPSNDGRQTQRLWSAVVCQALLAAYFFLRAGLFGDAWRVYTDGPSDGLLQAVSSVPDWWSGLTSGMHGLAMVYLALLATVALLAASLSAREGRSRLTLALGASTAGLILATLLNLGSLLPSGEGGRLLLTPMAWLAVTLGTGLVSRDYLPASIARGGFALTAAMGAVMLGLQYGQLRDTQDSTRQFTQQIAEWSENHPGTTLLIIPEQVDRLPIFRNAQSGLVMPPLQGSPLLHRVIPTLDRELSARHAQIADGLITRINAMRPSQVDWKTVEAMLQPAPARWPEHYACWSWAQPAIQPLEAPRNTESSTAWLASLSDQAGRTCGLNFPKLR